MFARGALQHNIANSTSTKTLIPKKSNEFVFDSGMFDLENQKKPVLQKPQFENEDLSQVENEGKPQVEV